MREEKQEAKEKKKCELFRVKKYKNHFWKKANYVPFAREESVLEIEK